MDEYTIKVNGGTPTVMIRKGPDGNLVESEMKREDYIVPPEDRYRLRITGFAKPFEMADSFNNGQMKTCTRLEFTIAGGRGDGHRFTDLFTWTVGPKSNLGKVFAAALNNGVPLEKGQDARLPMLLDTEIDASTKVGDDLDEQGRPKYVSLVKDTIRPAGSGMNYDPFGGAQPAAEPTATPVGAPGPAPF